MMKPKIQTTISKLMPGDYFIPVGQDIVYCLLGYDDDWCLWIGKDPDGNYLLFDDFRCIWLPCYKS